MKYPLDVSDVPPMAPSLDEMRQSMRLDSFYREMYERAQRAMEHIGKQNEALRRQVTAALALAEESKIEAQHARWDADEWRRIAVKYGAVADTEWTRGDYTVHGHVAISVDLIMTQDEGAIHEVCRNLAEKLLRDRVNGSARAVRTGGET